MACPNDHLVDKIFPTQEVHLVAGPSGAGKTTWLLKFIDTWRQKTPFLGYEVNPQPFIYISADRSQRSVERVFVRMKLDPVHFRVETLMGFKSRNSLVLMLKDRLNKYPETKVFFVEGIQSFTPFGKINDYVVVSQFLTDLVRFCIEEDVTVIGVAHATKTKKDETYENPRQKIAGSVAWAAFTDTIIFIEPSDAKNPNDSTRTVMVLPRNAAERSYKMEFKDGILIEKTKPQTSAEKFAGWYAKTLPGQTLTTEEILVAIQIPRSTLAVEIENAINKKLLTRIKTGVYRRPHLLEIVDA